MQRLLEQIEVICGLTVERDYLDEVRAGCAMSGLTDAVAAHDTPVIVEHLLELASFAGVSDAIAERYLDEHGRVRFSDLQAGLGSGPSCPRLRSYWHFDGCGFRKLARTCAEPEHIAACPLPRHDLRNGRLSMAGYALALFARDVADGDLVGWIDRRLAEADVAESKDRGRRLREAVLEPLASIYGFGRKVAALALSSLLLGAAPDRERWVTAGAHLVVVDTLVHNWLHRTGALRRLGAEHAYGPRCYALGGCASIIEEAARAIDARQFCPDGPAYFPRLIQKALWTFCAEGGLAICNGNRLDDRFPCEQSACPFFRTCERLPLHA